MLSLFDKYDFTKQPVSEIPWRTLVLIMQDLKYMSQFAKEFTENEIM